MKLSKVYSLITATLLAGNIAWAGGDNVPVDNTTGYVPFVGVEIGGVEGTVNGWDTDHHFALGLRGGYEDEMTRIFLSYHYVHFDDADVMDLMLNLEAMTVPYVFSDMLSTRVFVGGHIGTTYVNPDAFDSEFDLAGGLQGGLLFDFGTNVDLEVGYRYTWTNWKDNGYKLKHYDNIYTGINYRF
jgi:hypothetical protein